MELELAPLHVVLDLSLLKALSDKNDGSDAAAGRQVDEGESTRKREPSNTATTTAATDHRRQPPPTDKTGAQPDAAAGRQVGTGERKPTEEKAHRP